MDKFYVGAKVVCVDASEPDPEYFNPLVKGRVYEVESIRKAKCCGLVEIHVGLFSEPGYDECACSVCFVRYIDPCPEWWHEAYRFRLLEPDIELSETRSDEILDLINANT